MTIAQMKREHPEWFAPWGGRFEKKVVKPRVKRWGKSRLVLE